MNSAVRSLGISAGQFKQHLCINLNQSLHGADQLLHLQADGPEGGGEVVEVVLGRLFQTKHLGRY